MKTSKVEFRHDRTRRQILKGAAALTGAGLISPGISDKLWQALAAPASTCSTVKDIEHVIIFIQENRSFDHYFGSYRGVRGFADTKVPIQPNGRNAFAQPDPLNTNNPPLNYLLPFHLDTMKTNAACTPDITHAWEPQHKSWNKGLMNGFVTSRISSNSNDAVLTMGYYKRSDLPFYYAVADAFTLCDNYFCPVIGPTDPNRLYTISATIDPDGKNGGPLIDTLSDQTRQEYYGRFTWTTMPEQLQARGISWKVYSSPDSTLENNVLAYFKRFQDPSSPLFQQAFVPSFPGTFNSDALSGNLPQVSWILAPLVDSEHPPAPSLFGENDLNEILTTLTANPSLWAKTVVFATYDENGGFFDHVPPVTPEPGEPGEYLTALPVPEPASLGTPPIYGPIGLGFRVPMTIISPFSRGGFVNSGLFDHTSVLRFLETRFGAEVPNLSGWRRRTVGDLVNAFNFAQPNPSVPKLPATFPPDQQTIKECLLILSGAGTYEIPNPQVAPIQEVGKGRTPSGPCNLGTILGSGSIDSAKLYNFNFHVNSTLTGFFDYEDKTAEINFEANTFTYYASEGQPGAGCATFRGNAQLKDGRAVTFSVEACDDPSFGTGDTFSVRVSDTAGKVLSNRGGKIASGNIKLS